jgi:hypothetical protein
MTLVAAGFVSETALTMLWAALPVWGTALTLAAGPVCFTAVRVLAAGFVW